MLNQEKYFDELYEYVDLWASGYVKAHLPNLNSEQHFKLRNRVLESISNRLDAINNLKIKIGLNRMSVDECYDYYINNILDFDDLNQSVEFKEYDARTEEIENYTKNLGSKPANAEAYLIVIGAPDVYLKNYHVLQERVDLANKMLTDNGYPKLTPQKTEELLLRILVVNY